MSNIEINNLMKKESKIFKGCIMQDEIHKINPNIEGSYIVNYENSYQNGNHWVGVYIKPKLKQILYFDSYGILPLEPIIELAKNSNYKIKYNKHIIQSLDEVICGELSVSFILLIEKGYNFNQVIKMFLQ